MSVGGGRGGGGSRRVNYDDRLTSVLSVFCGRSFEKDVKDLGVCEVTHE